MVDTDYKPESSDGGSSSSRESDSSSNNSGGEFGSDSDYCDED